MGGCLQLPFCFLGGCPQLPFLGKLQILFDMIKTTFYPTAINTVYY
jgi:hypothetical protein